MKMYTFFKRSAALAVSFVIAAVLVFSELPVPVHAEDTDDTGYITENGETSSLYADKDRVVDNLGLLSDSEEQRLEELFDRYSEELQFDIVLLTSDTLEGCADVMRYADEYFEENGYGVGDTRDGAIFVRYLNGSEKEVWISTCGTGLICLYDDYIDAIYEELTPAFLDGRYYEAFKIFGDMTADSVRNWEQGGEPTDVHGNSGNTYYYDEEQGSYFNYIYGKPDYSQNYPFYYWIWLFIRGCILPTVIGLIFALIKTGSMKKQLRSVETAGGAAQYERKNSFVLRVSTDNLVRTNTTKTRHVEASSYSGGRSGGGGHVSSSRHSSGGFSHGGGGRHM